MGAIRTVHAWAGVFLALLAVVLGLTGTLLVFEDDWIRATVPAARAETDLDPVRLGAAMERVEAASPQVKSVTLAGTELGVHRLYLPEEGAAYADRSGTVIADWQGTARVESFVFNLHHYLLAGDTGELVAGSAGLALSLLMLTGLIAWIPAWRASGWRVWPRSTKRREMIGSHRNLGLIFALPLTMLALTGSAMVFSKTAQAILNGGPPPTLPIPVVGTGDIDWAVALASAQRRYPNATLRMAIWPSEPGKPASIRMRQPGEWHPNGRTSVSIDPATSQAVASLDAMTLPTGIRAYNAFYAIHSSSIGGRLYDLITALSGLAMAGLGGVGAWAFIARHIKAGRRRASPVKTTEVYAQTSINH